MRLQHIIFTLACGILSTAFAIAQPFSSLRKYDISDGISENTVRTIVQDKTGYIWLGTKDGICRYNGDGFRNYGGYPKKNDAAFLDVIKLCPHSDGQKIWIGTVDGIHLFNPHDETFMSLSEKIGVNSTVNDICYDNIGNLWIASGNGLFRYDEKSDTVNVYKYSPDKGALPSNVALSLLKDSSGDIWVGTRAGLALFHKGLNKFIPYAWVRNNNNGKPLEINHMTEGVNGEIWIGTHYDGLLCFDRLTGSFQSFSVSTGKNGNTWIRAVHRTPDNNLFIGTEDGLFTFDIGTRKVKHVKDFSRAVIYAFMQDHEGGIWLGTYFDGMYYIPPQNTKINRFHEVTGEKNSLSGKAISQFCEDKDGNIWIATEDEGLNHFNTSTGRFTHYKADTAPPKRISHNNIHALMLNGSNLWIGTFSKGIDILDTNKGRVVRNYRHDPNNPESIPNDHIYSFLKTRTGEIYVGTMKGFCRWIPESNSFFRYKELKNTFVYDIVEDERGWIWISSKNDGVWCINYGKFKSYKHDENDTTSIGSNHIIRSYIDSSGNLWFATEGGGICRYDYDSDSFINYNHTKKLYHHIVYGILDDEDGNLWLSTTKGIVQYNPTTFESRTYTTDDGMQSDQFNYRSSMKSSDGKFYFGGINGFNSFYPEEFRTNTVEPRAIISEIVLHKKGSGEETIKPKGKVLVDPDVASFDISFECLSYISPSKNRYAYKLEPLHADWIYTDKPSVSFIELPAGHYNLYLKAANNDGVWSSQPSRVEIVIKNPFYKTAGAKLLYFLIATLIVILFIRWQRKENRDKREREKKEIEMSMLQENYRSKFQFFTHVAHEIKTPLTLIKAPLDVIIENGKCDPETQESLKVMQQNTNRLLELIRQLLNFRKIDKEGYRVNYILTDINDLVKSTVKRFNGTDRDISIGIELPEISESYWIDTEAITKILSNLLSNGLKYARTRIVVKLEAIKTDDRNILILNVSDDGPGVSDSEAEKILEPFYRSADSGSENGFGIGLSLVKLLVDKMDGSILVGRDHDLGGLAITVSIPEGEEIKNVTSEESAKEEGIKETPSLINIGNQEASLLIVEDTREMLDFLLKNLGQKFKVFGATNGKEALAVLEDTSIDIILSDVAMPEMDGFELLYNIRSDKMLCHIPVILLSAQSNVNSKIAGLEYGADAYIEKPFSINHVAATIDSLLKNRRLLFERFSSMPNLNYGKGGIKAGDAEWLEQLTDIIKKNLTNEKFTVDVLAAEMAVSRSNLRRKIIGVTGLAPNDYIRLVRLKVAAELLQEGKYRINEVCYLVGFSSHSYFSSCFQKQFGTLPKDFVKN